ncbi:hypothetical protein OKJ48_14970 [Streptomyces kunmingensis]|uniref:Uncharacterized protein n=1 Tax=Streptomyces kunmingensis TaxID=68225 RepID=A0ABU6CA02_9ACTN|nr:hypothetical protein [Streptomyces kunmingensis]MEB3961539.1 hypothetical protein [Streptomyces kunmingensis]
MDQPENPGCTAAPIVVHRSLGTGGRRVTARGRILGLAHCDADVTELLRRAELPDAEMLLDDRSFMEWRGGRAHHYEAA